MRISEIRRPTQAELRGAVEYVVRDLEQELGIPGGSLAGAPIADMLPTPIRSLRALRRVVRAVVADWLEAPAQAKTH